MEAVVVLGLGNILYADEGFGVRVAEYLYERFVFPMNAEIVDAGTQGHTLLHYVERADRLLLLDAVDFGLDPGSLIVRDSTGIPAYLSAQKMSLHQNSFSEILALAEFRNRLPQEIRLIGFQPADLRYGKSLSISARSELPRAADLALTTLRQWGIFPEKRLTSEEFQDQSISLRAF